MDIRKIIFGIMIFVFVLVLFVPVKTVPPEKKCSVDSDCALVRTVCCPSCDGGTDSVNTKYSEQANKVVETGCNDTECPPLYCENKYGEAYTLKPVCINKTCSLRSEFNCNAICSYLKNKDRYPYSVYLNNIAMEQGLYITKLTELCGCS